MVLPFRAEFAMNIASFQAAHEILSVSNILISLVVSPIYTLVKYAISGAYGA